jgi:hypothetical protein
VAFALFGLDGRYKGVVTLDESQRVSMSSLTLVNRDEVARALAKYDFPKLMERQFADRHFPEMKRRQFADRQFPEMKRRDFPDFDKF